MTEYFKNENLYIKSNESGCYLKDGKTEKKLSKKDTPVIGYVCLDGESISKKEYDSI